MWHFVTRGERKNARGAKKREDMLSSRCGASVIEFASHRVSFNTRGSREIFISMYMHSRTCTPKSARYSKAHSDFRRFVLQSIHRVPNNLISTVLFLYYWNAKWILPERWRESLIENTSFCLRFLDDWLTPSRERKLHSTDTVEIKICSMLFASDNIPYIIIISLESEYRLISHLISVLKLYINQIKIINIIIIYFIFYLLVDARASNWKACSV